MFARLCADESTPGHLAEGHAAADILLFLDESVAEAKDKYVGFNLAGIKQVRFTQSEDFASKLRVNIEKFFII